MPWTYEQLEYPKTRLSERKGVEFSLPSLSDYDEDDNEVIHPLVGLLKSGKEIEAITTHECWRDDRCECMNVIATVEGKQYGFSAWWLSSDGVKMMIRAESGTEKALSAVKEYVVTYG